MRGNRQRTADQLVVRAVAFGVVPPVAIPLSVLACVRRMRPARTGCRCGRNTLRHVRVCLAARCRSNQRGGDRISVVQGKGRCCRFGRRGRTAGRNNGVCRDGDVCRLGDGSRLMNRGLHVARAQAGSRDDDQDGSRHDQPRHTRSVRPYVREMFELTPYAPSSNSLIPARGGEKQSMITQRSPSDFAPCGTPGAAW